MTFDGLGSQALRFGGVGVLATLVHVSVAWLISQTVLPDPFQANAAGFLAAFAISYAGHFYFTFQLASGHRQALLRFLAMSLAGLGLSNILVWLISVRLQLPFFVAMVGVGLAVPAGSFVIARAWAFNRAAKFDLLPPLLILTAGAATYLFYGANLLTHDASWYLVATRKWLGGAVIYRDLMEINPPLAFFLTVPGLWLADTLGISDTLGFILSIVAMSAASLLTINGLLLKASDLTALSRHAVLAGAALALLVLPMADFGQREHLMLILALPCFILLAFSSVGLRVGLGATVVIGLAAAFGLALKPYFLLAPLALSLASAWQERSLRPLFHPVNWVIGTVCVGYVLLIWLAFPLYLTQILPLGGLVYWAFGSGIGGTLLQPVLILAPFAALAVIIGAGPGRARAVSLRLLAIAAGFGLAYLVQGKGWSYQSLPLAALLMVALAFSAAAGRMDWRKVSLAGGLCAAMVLAVPLFTGPYRNVYVEEFADVLAKGPQQPALLVLSTRVSAGFPLTNVSNARWVSRYPTQWVLPGTVRQLAQPQCAAADACVAARDALDAARTATIQDMIRLPPDVVIVDIQARKTYFGDTPFDYLDWLRGDPGFASVFAAYRLEASFSGHEIWRRAQ